MKESQKSLSTTVYILHYSHYSRLIMSTVARCAISASVAGLLSNPPGPRGSLPTTVTRSMKRSSG